MNCQQRSDYRLFPSQPTTDWTAAVLDLAEPKPDRLNAEPRGTAVGDTPIQMRTMQAVPQNHCRGINQGVSQTDVNCQSWPAESLACSNTRKSAEGAKYIGTEERLAYQKNLVRIQNALRRGIWAPDHGHLSVSAGAKVWARQMDGYLGNLQVELTAVPEPLERCLRVVVCITTLAQKYNCQDDSSAADYLTSSFGIVFCQTLRLCLAAIKAQATVGYARDYFDVCHFIMDFLQRYPELLVSDWENARGEIKATLNGLIETELDYLQYTVGFPRRGEYGWLVGELKQLLRVADFYRTLQLANDQETYWQKLQALEISMQKQCSANPGFPHQIDLLIAGGNLKIASDFLAARGGDYPLQTRLVYEILQQEYSQVVMSRQAVGLDQALAKLFVLNLSVKIYQQFISSHFLLFHHIRTLLSDIVIQLLTCHKAKIGHHEKRREAEVVLNELANCRMLSDQCLSLWRSYQQSAVPIEDSLVGMTSRDGLALFKDVTRRLSNLNRTHDDYQRAAQDIRRWVISENILPSMNQGERLVRMMKLLKKKLCCYFFHEIFIDGFVRSKYDFDGYRKIIKVMDKHRKKCLENQAFLFLLKDMHHFEDWQHMACRAWGKLISDLRVNIFHGEIISEKMIDDVLSLGIISPSVVHHFTRIDLKKLTIELFKEVVRQPVIIQVSYYKLHCLAKWVLAIVDAEPAKNYEELWRNNAVRKTVSIYINTVYAGREATDLETFFLPQQMGRVDLFKTPVNDIYRQWQAIMHEVEGSQDQPMASYQSSLLACMPLSIISRDEHNRLYDSLVRVGMILDDILARNVTHYGGVAKKDLDRIDLCLANLAPWFRQFCTQKECNSFAGRLTGLTKLDCCDRGIHLAFAELVVNRIRLADISGAVNIVCVQQALYRIRAALGLPAIG